MAAAVWDGASVRTLDRGLPQGSPLSPLLANVYLDPFDRELRRFGVPLVRYADDFLAFARTPFGLAELRPLVEQALGSRGLSLNVAKTRATSFDAGFRFLGARLQGSDILLPLDRKKTRQRAAFVAPAMPAALTRAFRAGLLKSRGPFEWHRTRDTEPKVEARPTAVDRLQALSRCPAVQTLQELRTGGVR
jgi:hypothetical protein